jgi:hypothetical protein
MSNKKAVNDRDGEASTGKRHSASSAQALALSGNARAPRSNPRSRVPKPTLHEIFISENVRLAAYLLFSGNNSRGSSCRLASQSHLVSFGLPLKVLSFVDRKVSSSCISRWTGQSIGV